MKMKKLLRNSLISVLILLALVGIFDFYNFFKMNSTLGFGYIDPDNSEQKEKMFTIGNSWATILTWKTNFINESDYKIIEYYSAGYTRHCENDFCRAEALYLLLKDNWRYNRGLIVNSAVKILKDHEGDCDEMAFLYTSMLNTLDIPSTLQCNSDHCWNVIRTENQTIKVDIVHKKFEIIDEEENKNEKIN